MHKTLKRLGVWALVVAAILAIPFFGKWPWTSSDFIFAGTVLFGAATLFELVTSQMKNKTHRIVVGVGVLGLVLLIWAWAVGGP